MVSSIIHGEKQNHETLQYFNFMRRWIADEDSEYSTEKKLVLYLINVIRYLSL